MLAFVKSSNGRGLQEIAKAMNMHMITSACRAEPPDLARARVDDELALDA